MGSLFKDVMKKTEKKPKEIFETVVETILDELTVRPKKDEIPLDFKNPRLVDIEPFTVLKILEKLQFDFGVIKKFDSPPSLSYVSNPPEPTPENPVIYNTFYVEVNEKFENWANYFLYADGSKVVVDKIERKYTRKSLEKIWGLLYEIENKRGITLKGDDISIPQVHFSKARNEREAIDYSKDRLSLLRKLEYEEYAIKDVVWPDDFHGYITFKLGSGYYDAYNFYKEEYEKVAKEYEANKSLEQTKDGPVYKIIYTPNREILLDGRYLIAKPNFESENETVFTYIYNNPNRRITRKEIEEKTKKILTKTLPNILDKLRIKGDLKEAFFTVSSEAVEFRNPVTQEMLEKLGIKRIKI